MWGPMWSSSSRYSVVVKFPRENYTRRKNKKEILSPETFFLDLTASVVFLRKFNDECNDDWTTTDAHETKF